MPQETAVQNLDCSAQEAAVVCRTPQGSPDAHTTQWLKELLGVSVATPHTECRWHLHHHGGTSFAAL